MLKLEILFIILCLALFYGCSNVGPPDDYYNQVVDMEDQGEQVRQEAGRRPGEIVVPPSNPEPIKVAKTPAQQVVEEAKGQKTIEEPVIQETTEAQEKPAQRETIRELSQEPIALEAEVIKSALNSSDLKVGIRTVELLNGRLSGGKNSIRINFIPESIEKVDEKFGSICAVVYYLDSESNTVDVIVGLAEDKQSNLLAILQSNMEDILSWMTSEITRTEWYSRITKKTL